MGASPSFRRIVSDTYLDSGTELVCKLVEIHLIRTCTNPFSCCAYPANNSRKGLARWSTYQTYSCRKSSFDGIEDLFHLLLVGFHLLEKTFKS